MSSKDILVSLLSKTELFKGLAVGDIEACVPSFRKAKFKKGQALITCGERATGLYLVAKGRVRLAIATEDGRELSLCHATSGELLGEIAALDGGTRSAALHPMHVRLARFFLVAIGDRKPVPGKRLPLDLGMSQDELALLPGASRPKINEALGKLEEIGAIGRTLDRIFCDPQKLAEVDGAHA
jgi:CRP/FNR family transcriptional regulator, cyclic AMP receptor protein